ncbi:MAG TPA: VWA domain-containing protein [Gemmatimonadaceae bacterium]|jgi:Mg-chelatase subunit ChlD
MRLANPFALALLVLVAGYLWLRWPRRTLAPRRSMALPTLALLDEVPRAGRESWLWLPVLLRAAALALLVVAIARPQSPGDIRDERLSGRNIVLVLDISSSMKATDLGAASRLETAKRVLTDFVRSRRGDFIGLVVFASRPFTQAPLTDDDGVLAELIARADIGLLADGTAIGSALAMAENKLKDLPRNSGVIVLVTDGGNNVGNPDPLTAASLARAIGIRIYAVGVGAPSDGPAPLTERDAWWRRGMAHAQEDSTFSTNDEKTLQQVAAASGGVYYRAANASALREVVERIDQLEKSEIRVRDVRSWREHFVPLVVAAILLLALEMTLRTTWLRTLP